MAQLSNFIGALKDGGSRAAQFEVEIAGAPVGVPNDFKFLCRGTTVPTLTIAEVEVPYRGRNIYVAGDRSYDAWEITVFSDRDQTMRAFFETWQNHMGDIGIRTDRSEMGSSPSGYYANASVKQLDKNDDVLRTYHLYDVWPTAVNGSEMTFDSGGGVMEFGVSFRFNYMTIAGTGASSPNATATLSIEATFSGGSGR